jgi:hypothetical protein
MKGSHIFWIAVGFSFYGYWLYMLFSQLSCDLPLSKMDNLYEAIFVSISVPLLIWEMITFLQREIHGDTCGWSYFTPICGIVYLIKKLNQFLDKTIGV